ncbi:MAG: VOC family protein [Planctomycetes bacterium]|nr:VOC family protein [Planctomycetota bacterium]
MADRALVSTALIIGMAPEAIKKVTGKAGKSAMGYEGSLLVQLGVADLDRAVKFYRDVMDFDVDLRDDELGWAKMSPGIPGLRVGLGTGPKNTGSGTVSMNFGVEDIEAARKLLESRGVKFLRPTVTIPGVVKLADFKDPDGNRIRLAEDLH